MRMNLDIRYIVTCVYFISILNCILENTTFKHWLFSKILLCFNIDDMHYIPFNVLAYRAMVGIAQQHEASLYSSTFSRSFVMLVDFKLPYINCKLFSTRNALQRLFKFTRTLVIDYMYSQEHLLIYLYIYIYIYMVCT